MTPILIPFIGMLQNWTCIIAQLACKVKETALHPCAESHIKHVLAITAVCGREGLIGIHKYLVYQLNHMVSSSCNRQKLFFPWLSGDFSQEQNFFCGNVTGGNQFCQENRDNRKRLFLCWLRDSVNSNHLSLSTRGHWWRLDI